VATVNCVSCGAENDSAETFCLRCSNVLTAGAPAPPAPQAEPDRHPAPVVLEGCPYCGADVPDPGNKACVECLRPFPAAEPPTREGPSSGDAVAGTRRDAATAVRLRLTFSAHSEAIGEVDVRPEEKLLVGREPGSRCAEILGARENVSRRHAVIGLEDDGAAWVCDEYSTNGTRLNDVPMLPGRRSVLEDGDRLAFGADVVASVRREGSR
jgi:hypothetical protein